MTHKESIALFRSLGTKFTPELKTPVETMPFEGFTREDYAQKLIDEYKEAGIAASDVFAWRLRQHEDIRHWIKNEPDFGKQVPSHRRHQPATAERHGPRRHGAGEPAALKAEGINYVAPAIPFLLTLDDSGKVVPSKLAVALKAADIKIITWSFERSGPLVDGGFYFNSITKAIKGSGDYYPVLDVLAQQVGVTGVFSDWPASVSYYASCMGLK